jgi:hypothetical protein
LRMKPLWQTIEFWQISLICNLGGPRADKKRWMWPQVWNNLRTPVVSWEKCTAFIIFTFRLEAYCCFRPLTSFTLQHFWPWYFNRNVEVFRSVISELRRSIHITSGHKTK